MKSKILKIVFSLIIFIALVHFISLRFYLYWDFWWLDIVMHFISGFWIALFALWLSLFSNILKNTVTKVVMYIILINFLALFIALVWEVFELNLSITFVKQSHYWLDTISDVLTTIVGSLTASLWLKSRPDLFVNGEKAF